MGGVRRAAAGVLVVTLLVAACGSSSDVAPSTTAALPSEPPETAVEPPDPETSDEPSTTLPAPPATAVEPPDVGCLDSGDQYAIGIRLIEHDVAVLCQGAVFELTGPVRFLADGQQVYTEGMPTDEARATLRLADTATTVAVDMLGRTDVVLAHVIVDGNRPELGYREGDALILAGGHRADGQVISAVRALDTRSWSTIHVIEGWPDSPCRGVVVEDNEIGPAGEPDGTWADGISLACTDSIVRRNVIVDATDGAIVVFGAPGSLIADNDIQAETRTMLGGINMVDYGPYDGDYTGTTVTGNVIEASGAAIRIAIGMGERVWGCRDLDDPEPRLLYGATVTGNVLAGEHMQYGFAVDGVTDWSVVDNVSEATHSGAPVNDCHGRLPASPGPFQRHSPRADGEFQPEFEEAFVELALWATSDPP